MESFCTDFFELLESSGAPRAQEWLAAPSPGVPETQVQALLLVVSHRMPFLVGSPSWFHRGRRGPAYLRVPLALEQAVTWGGLVTRWNCSAVPHLPARPQHVGRVRGGLSSWPVGPQPSWTYRVFF